jgi:phosphotransferase system enzyme I (PtsP)
MGPAELLDYDRARLRGVVLEEGSALSHVAIVARALDIPVVGRAPDVLARIEPGDPMIIDGDHAQVMVRPAEDIVQTINAAIEARAERQRKYAALRELPSATRDQARIGLHINAGLLIDMQHLDETGADGVGLYRTEIPFMVSMSAATRCCPMSARSATRTRRWAGAPSASASTARRCCAASCAP